MTDSFHRQVLKQRAERIGFTQEKRFTLRLARGLVFYLRIDEFGNSHSMEYTRNGSPRERIWNVHVNTIEEINESARKFGNTENSLE